QLARTVWGQRERDVMLVADQLSDKSDGAAHRVCGEIQMSKIAKLRAHLAACEAGGSRPDACDIRKQHRDRRKRAVAPLFGRIWPDIPEFLYGLVLYDRCHPGPTLPEILDNHIDPPESGERPVAPACVRRVGSPHLRWALDQDALRSRDLAAWALVIEHGGGERAVTKTRCFLLVEPG